MFKSFNDKNILIIGDIMIDEYVIGDVERISPEAPVQIVDYKKKIFKLGGAANVAVNIKSLGANPIICTVIGKERDKMHELLVQNEIKNYLYISKERKTTTKTRVVSNSNQLLRLDYESKKDLSKKENKRFKSGFEQAIKHNNIHAVILSDYNKGVLNKNNIQYIIKKCKKMNIPIIVDPKVENFYEYKNATIFKPNLKELELGIKKYKGLNKTNKYLKELGVEKLMITLSEEGVIYNDSEKVYKHKLQEVKISDVSGAGDTVTSVLTLLYINGFTSEKIVKLCNLAGSLSCKKIGVSTITQEQLEKEWKKLNN